MSPLSNGNKTISRSSQETDKARIDKSVGATIKDFINGFSIKIAAAVVICAAIYLYTCGQTQLLKTLPFLAIVALIAAEVFVGAHITRISQALEEQANARTLDSAALKEVSAKAGPELKSLLAPLFLTLATLESEKAADDNKEKDLQRWRARTAEIHEVKKSGSSQILVGNFLQCATTAGVANHRLE